MTLTWSSELVGVDWVALEHLYRVAPLGSKNAALLQTVFTNSRYRVFVYAEGELVGAGRALADGGDCAYLCDVAVLPRLQGRGLGKAIVERLMAASADHSKILLYAAPGKGSFYRKLGFRPLLSAMAIFKDREAAVARGHIPADE